MQIGLPVWSFITCLASILPSLYLVSVAFGTAIPTSLYIFWKMVFVLVCVLFLAQ